jgi:hypothetical protein
MKQIRSKSRIIVIVTANVSPPSPRRAFTPLQWLERIDCTQQHITGNITLVLALPSRTSRARRSDVQELSHERRSAVAGD